MPRMRAKSRERQLVRQRGEVADAHREQASARSARAEEAEQIAARERAEAELHETRARMHERGLADDELADDRERLGDEPFRPRAGRPRESASKSASGPAAEQISPAERGFGAGHPAWPAPAPGTPVPMPSKTQREREAEQRQAKLDRIQEQLDAGSLVIRKMTDAERERFSKHSKRNDADRAQRSQRRRSRAAASRPLPPVPRG